MGAMRRVKISERPAGRSEYASKSKAGHSSGGPKHPRREGANKPCFWSKEYSHPMIAMTLDQRGEAEPQSS